MNPMRRRDILIGSLLLTTAAATGAEAADPENTLVIELATGRVLIELRPDLAPQHVERIKELAREHFYDGVVFHRVIPGFMAQTGDPTGTGRGGSDKPDLKAEFSQEPFKRGTLGMARAASPNSANSQFFICFAPASHLNGQYTVWGEVTEGMDLVDRLAVGEPPRTPDKMISVRVLADAA
jgi:cyclophilin family peptidyl-prolyl cis-trans isomerase